MSVLDKDGKSLFTNMTNLPGDPIPPGELGTEFEEEPSSTLDDEIEPSFLLGMPKPPQK